MTISAVTHAECIASVLQRELDLQAEAEHSGTEFLWLWEAQRPAVVLGRSGDMSCDVRMEACIRDQVPVLKRQSGGGSVVLARGSLNYTLILNLNRRPELQDVARSYRQILSSILRAARIADAICIDSDLTIGGRKFGGCSQKRSRRTVLHHGTILYNFECGLVARYLNEPSRQPVYRSRRIHQDFLTNVPLDDGFASRLYAEYPDAEVAA